MRTTRIAGIGAAIVGIPIVGIITYFSWVDAQMVYPKPENKSSFLRAYDPKPVVRPFMDPAESYGEGDGSGGGAGTKFVRNFAHFGEYFTMRADQKGSLMVAVNYDVSQRLLMNGARILNQSGSSSTEYHITYATGNTIGEVSIGPLVPAAAHRNMPLPVGFEDVTLNIKVSEQWFPKGIPPGVAHLLPESDS
jgi:hypothetical protein